MGRTVTHLLVLAAVATLVMFVNLGGPPLWDRDEPRNAACAREMMERGDWVVPTFNDDLRVLKPALKYWLMIGAYHLFGVNEFAARFFSAVSALVAAWVTYLLARRLFGPRAGLLSGIVLLTSLLFTMAGHLAKIDATLTLASSLALLAYACFAFTPSAGEDGTRPGAVLTTPIPSWGAWALVYAAIGLAGLAKGLPGLVPAAVIGMFLLIMRLPDGGEPGGWWWRVGQLFRPFAPLHFLRTFCLMRPLTGALVVLAVAGPWYFLVGLRTDGEFLRGFFLTHNFGRALQPMEGHSGPFLLYYLVTVVAGLFPWSVFIPPLLVWLVAHLRKGGPRRDACLFLACWVGVYVVLFSCARTKLPSYITPCFPGLAILVGAFLDDVVEGVSGAVLVWLKLGLGTLVLAGTGLVVAAGLAGRFVGATEVIAVLGGALAAGGLAACVLLNRGRTLAATVAVCVTAVAFIGGAFGVLLPRVGALSQQDDVCAAIRRECPGARFGACGDIDPSWVFYAGRPIVSVLPHSQPPAHHAAWTARPTTLAEFVAGKDWFLIARDRDLGWLKADLPAEARVVAAAPCFLRKGRWVVITRPHRPDLARAGR